ncbi:MAG: YARHG domain-containing protein [Bacillota bacterium]
MTKKCFYALLILIGILLSGCSHDSKVSNDAQMVTPVFDKVSNEDTEIILVLNNLKFNLSMPFGDMALNELDSKDLSTLRNSIYAKYGYAFSTKELSEYFLQFSWYKATSKNVEDKLSITDKRNIEKVIALEKKKESIIKSSKDNKDYSMGGRVDIPLKGITEKETLFITTEDIKTSEQNNYPKKIELEIKSSKIIFESLWNDGLHVSLADFDHQDNDLDIYITEIGTDIMSKTYIYKFDGTRIYKYDELQHFGRNFLYDEKGNIYYWLNDGSKMEYNKCYDYKTKKSSNIVDNSLKVELNKLK